MAMPSWDCSAFESCSRKRDKRSSPESTKSVALSVVSGMCCATCAICQLAGIEKSPPSSCSEPFSNANSVDLPAPLRPTSPTFSPGWMVMLAPSSSTLAPRRSVRFCS